MRWLPQPRHLGMSKGYHPLWKTGVIISCFCSHEQLPRPGVKKSHKNDKEYSLLLQTPGHPLPLCTPPCHLSIHHDTILTLLLTHNPQCYRPPASSAISPAPPALTAEVHHLLEVFPAMLATKCTIPPGHEMWVPVHATSFPLCTFTQQLQGYVASHCLTPATILNPAKTEVLI